MTFDPIFVPRVQRQLDGTAVGARGCGRSTVDWLVTWATGGAIRPKDELDICERMGNPKCKRDGKLVGSSIQEVKRAGDSYQPDAAALGLNLPKMRIRSAATNSVVRPVSELMTVLLNGGAAALFVQYGVIDEAGYGGQPGLDVLHIIPIAGMRTDDERGRRWTTSYDPLYDGRREGIPNGPVEIPWNVIRRALGMTKDTTMGFGIFGTCARAVVIDAPPVPAPIPPVPTPTAPTVEELEAALQRARVAEAERDRAQVALGIIAQLAADIEWPRLIELAETGLPEPNTAAANEAVEEGGSPPSEEET